MQGVKYFLVVVAGVAGLSVATRLVYLRNPAARGQASAPSAKRQSPEAVQAPGEIVNAPSATAPGAKRQAPTAIVQAPGAIAQAPVAKRPAPKVAVRASSPRPKATPNVKLVADSAPGIVEAPKAPEPVIDTTAAAVETPPWQATPRQVARDSAYVMATSGRLQAAIGVLESWVRGHPADVEVGIDLARLRARAGDWKGSIDQYTSLIEQNRTPQLLFERGQTYLWAGDAKRGEADLLTSERLSPNAMTERQLGDHYRWQGDFTRSAKWYRRAMRKAPADTAVRNSMRLLDRAIDARLLMPGELAGSDLGSGVQAISDNAGFDLYSLRLSQAFGLPMGSSSVMTLSGEMRSATQMSLGGIESQLDAYGFDLSMSTRAGASKLTASVGMLDHGDASPIVRGALMTDGFLGSARVKASVRRAAAYEVLWAPRMLAATGSPATALQAQGSVSQPLGSIAELYAMGELLGVSDDNTRTTFQVALRRPLPANLALVYSASYMAYDQQTALYYSPARYHAQALGVELARYRDQGLSFAMRATPGYAWIREPAGTADSVSFELSALQFATGMELGYRRGAWDLLLSTGLSSGREGGYRSQNALLHVRRAW
jgi:hypothetical protein